MLQVEIDAHFLYCQASLCLCFRPPLNTGELECNGSVVEIRTGCEMGHVVTGHLTGNGEGMKDDPCACFCWKANLVSVTLSCCFEIHCWSGAGFKPRLMICCAFIFIFCFSFLLLSGF